MSIYRIPAQGGRVFAHHDPMDVKFIWRIEQHAIPGGGLSRQKWPAEVFYETFGRLNSGHWRNTNHFSGFPQQKEDGTYAPPQYIYEECR
jgi:hypothetical protein